MHRDYSHLLFRRHWEVSKKATYELGQCDSIIRSICETPIKPEYHKKLLNVSLAKGALATTAIEGNTLTEAEVDDVANGKKLPPSKEYQEIEVRNILGAMNELLKEVAVDDREQLITPDLIKRFHKLVGKDLGEHFDAIPGKFRTDARKVGPYQCPDHRDVPELVQNLCDWLKGEFGYQSGRQTFSDSVIQAIVAHVYLEWIHPFGDGNGRTGRLLEFYILLRAGNPDIGSHILSNHYNLTRPEYYRQIDLAYKKKDLSYFIDYAIEGFRDGLHSTLRLIQENQFETAWKGYVYECFAEKTYTKKNVFKRRRDLMLSIPLSKGLSLDQLMIVSADLARIYAKLSLRTLKRDVEELLEMNLVVFEEGIFRANTGVLRLRMARRINRTRQNLS